MMTGCKDCELISLLFSSTQGYTPGTIDRGVESRCQALSSKTTQNHMAHLPVEHDRAGSGNRLHRVDVRLEALA